MKNFRHIWIFGLLATVALLALPLIFFIPREPAAGAAQPIHGKVERRAHVDHKALLEGPFTSGSEVTRACLECHPDSAKQVMGTVHWTWESKPYELARFDEPVTIGKKTSINNFCIGIQSNWAGCTSCHAGYGWDSADFDFTAEEKVDCLVCHDQSGGYVKGEAGLPMEGVDLLAAARSVGYPTRSNCGGCHFNGGGGNAVKHGDLDQHLFNPGPDLDVHMGGQDFACTDCHTTQDHLIRGRATSVSLDNENQVYCTDCHQGQQHSDERLNAHTASVACQACHIPYGALKDPTKMYWDWSQAGEDRGDDPHTYLKIKGSFVYEERIVPEYYWYSGVKDRYILGDVIDPSRPTQINTLAGDIHDPAARIFPFKVHRGKQPYDTVNNWLVQPSTAGEGGYWDTFDWNSAIAMGMQTIGMPYSGEYGFADTEMYWPITHLVAPARQALQCTACHGEQSRLDWTALGYPGDPLYWGGRFSSK